MTLMEIAPAAKSCPFHCHSAEEELFVVLDGDGHRCGSATDGTRCGPATSCHGPPAPRIAHQFIAGDGGMTVLAYSNIEPNDLAFYPDSSKVKLRGLNV